MVSTSPVVDMTPGLMSSCSEQLGVSRWQLLTRLGMGKGRQQQLYLGVFSIVHLLLTESMHEHSATGYTEIAQFARNTPTKPPHWLGISFNE